MKTSRLLDVVFLGHHCTFKTFQEWCHQTHPKEPSHWDTEPKSTKNLLGKCPFDGSKNRRFGTGSIRKIIGIWSSSYIQWSSKIIQDEMSHYCCTFILQLLVLGTQQWHPVRFFFWLGYGRMNHPKMLGDYWVYRINANPSIYWLVGGWPTPIYKWMIWMVYSGKYH